MNTESAVEKKKETIQDKLEKNKPSIKSMLPSHVDVERFIKSALLAIARNPKLGECDPKTLLTAIVNAAELGLDFTPAKRHAYLVPFRNNKTGQIDVQFMPGYGGLIDLCIRGGKVKRIEAKIVHENDVFTIEYGTNPKIIHQPTLEGEPGKVKGAYAVAWFGEGDPQFEWMNLQELNGIRARSKAKDTGPWSTDTEEMYRKTVLRRIFKYLPSSPDDKLARAIELDNKVVGFDETIINGNTSRTADLASMISGQSEDAEFEEGNGKSETEFESDPDFDPKKEEAKKRKEEKEGKLL